ncbi:MAG: hypothetical protein HZA15_13425 [Nitrospirae bacterium]|nr:hypothetical protein [Nitrospirota bacterium]
MDALYRFILYKVNMCASRYENEDIEDLTGEIYCCALARRYVYIDDSLFIKMFLGALEKLRLAPREALRPKKNKSEEKAPRIVFLSLERHAEEIGYEHLAIEEHREAHEKRERVLEALESAPRRMRDKALAVLAKDENLGRGLTKYCASIRQKLQAKAE